MIKHLQNPNPRNDWQINQNAYFCGVQDGRAVYYQKGIITGIKKGIVGIKSSENRVWLELPFDRLFSSIKDIMATGEKTGWQV